MSRPIHTAILLATALATGGCTTLGLGTASQPVGIHPHSFRQCLLDNGFFGSTALVGTSLEDQKMLRADRTDSSRTRREILGLSDPAFIALTAKRIRTGLMPHLQYGGGVKPGEPALGNTVKNRPYATNLNPGPYPADGYPANGDQDLKSAVADSYDWAVNRYLDCYIAPVGMEKADAGTPAPGGLFTVPQGGSAARPITQDGDADIEGRLLRAHIMVALFADYGLELIKSRRSERSPEQAARLLKHLRSADAELRVGSLAMNPALRTALAGVPGDRQQEMRFEWTYFAGRVLRIFQAGVDLQMIDAQLTLDRASNILAAFSAPTPGAFKSILKDAISGFASVQKIGLFGDALLRDARATLAIHRTSLEMKDGKLVSNKDVTGRLWRQWDVRLQRACNHLAGIAQDPDPGCVASDEEMKKQTPKLLMAMGLETVDDQ